MTRRRALAAATVGVAALSLAWAGGVISLPWTHDLDNQVSIKPQEMPVPPPEGAVPITGVVVDPPREQSAGITDPRGAGASADTSALRRGASDYRTFCAPCHGAAGRGDGAVARALPIPPANLADPAFLSTRTDGAMYYVIRHGSVIMPGYAYALTPEDSWNVVHYVRTLSGP